MKTNKAISAKGRYLPLAAALGTLLTAASGCSSADPSSDEDGVFPDVVLGALFEVDRSKPDELAAMQVDLRISAGPEADHRRVTLARVGLGRIGEPEPAMEIAASFRDGGAITLPGGQQVTVALVNEGTTNSELSPFCGQKLYLAVGLHYEDDPSAAGSDTKQIVTVSCH